MRVSVGARVATAEQMRRCDAMAISDWGIPGLELMEHAGRGMVAAMAEQFGELAGRKVVIFVGPGNNGGDGLVIARLLFERKARPQVVCCCPPERLQGDAAANLERVRTLELPLGVCLAEEDLAWVERMLAGSDLVVDALFGVGLAREVAGLLAEVVGLINAATAPVIAVDIPSGLDSDSGRPLGVCVRADLTCACGLAKFAQVQPPGKEYVGRLVVIDIGIPQEVVEAVGVEVVLLDGVAVRPWISCRPLGGHKGTFGHLLTVAGSQGKAGAALLCGRGALRCGVGLLTMAAPKGLVPIFQATLPEAMAVAMPFSQHHFSEADIEAILAVCEGKAAMAMGPGLGTDPDTGALVRRLYGELPFPMVVDADALNLLAGEDVLLTAPPAVRVLTPHPGEMARLAGKSTRELQEDRLAVARDFATRHGVWLVLKGAATVIAGPDGRVAINPTGNPGMATGGMGDVLTGLLSGLLAQGVAPWEAACLAVYMHGLAGDRLVEEGRPFGFLASEVADALPAAFAAVLAQG
ncbi:MAG: NAD(P)H-hydrate dehydratase [Thermodesulfobacteriota bacterium]